MSGGISQRINKKTNTMKKPVYKIGLTKRRNEMAKPTIGSGDKYPGGVGSPKPRPVGPDPRPV